MGKSVLLGINVEEGLISDLANSIGCLVGNMAYQVLGLSSWRKSFGS